jgi:hypothetical protein
MSAARKQRLLCFFALVFFLFEPPLEKRASAQAPEDKPAGPAPLVRPCTGPTANSKQRRKDKTKAKSGVASDETAIACLEAKDSALNIQEFFQSYVRT